MSLSRRNPRRDTAEKAIIAALRAVGCQVTQVSGKGAPDLLVKRGASLWAFEVKSGKGTRTEAQHQTGWPIVRTVDEALAMVGVRTNPATKAAFGIPLFLSSRLGERERGLLRVTTVGRCGKAMTDGLAVCPRALRQLALFDRPSFVRCLRCHQRSARLGPRKEWPGGNGLQRVHGLPVVRMDRRTEHEMLTINACAYCGQKAQGHYAIERDGVGSKPALPLCDACGGHERPTIQEIWARIALLDDDETEWGPTPSPCWDPSCVFLP